MLKYSKFVKNYWFQSSPLLQWEIFQHRSFLDGCQKLSREDSHQLWEGLEQIYNRCFEDGGQPKESLTQSCIHKICSTLGRLKFTFMTNVKNMPKAAKSKCN